MSGDSGAGGGRGEVSDLIGVKLTLVFTAWLLLMLAAFFFVGMVVGIVMVFVGVIGFGWYGASVIRGADTTS